jgi:3-deoxy-D-manno-octulosonic acid (KDO) 8-phosphate synthase
LTVASRFPRDAIFLIAGPCVLEDDALNLRVGEHLARLAESVPGGIIFKASFDKANRSNADAHRRPPPSSTSCRSRRFSVGRLTFSLPRVRLEKP